MNIGSLVTELLKASLCIGLTVFATTTQARGVKTASAEIFGCNVDGSIGGSIGMAFLWEKPSKEGIKQVRIYMDVDGLEPGKHAVHLHEKGSCEPCGGGAGGHFDPGPNSNTNPDGNHPYHSGDLVNIKVDDKGRGRLLTTTQRVTLSDGPLSLNDENGSAFIIHTGEDTYCPENVPDMYGNFPSVEELQGCAGGGRAACGIIVFD